MSLLSLIGPVRCWSLDVRPTLYSLGSIGKNVLSKHRMNSSPQTMSNGESADKRAIWDRGLQAAIEQHAQNSQTNPSRAWNEKNRRECITGHQRAVRE